VAVEDLDVGMCFLPFLQRVESEVHAADVGDVLARDANADVT
jgi:hypothetical protein